MLARSLFSLRYDHPAYAGTGVDIDAAKHWVRGPTAIQHDEHPLGGHPYCVVQLIVLSQWVM